MAAAAAVVAAAAGAGGADSMNLSISGSPEELETGFQLAYLLLTEPKVEAAALDQMKISAKEMLAESTKNPMMFGMPVPHPPRRTRTTTPASTRPRPSRSTR